MIAKSRRFLVTVAAFMTLVFSHSDLWGMAWLLAEQKEVTSGSFQGFVIGGSKRAALENLTRLGAQDLMAIPLPPDLVTKVQAPMDVLRFIEMRNGIRLTDLQGLEIQLFFEGGVIEKVESRGIGVVELALSKSQPKAYAANRLVRLLSDHPNAYVESVARIDSAYWGALNRSGRASEVLSGYDGWHFIVSKEGPSGATYRLFFADDRLIRLEYDRPRFRK